MRSFIRPAIPFLILWAAIAFTGCNVNPEKSPAFIKLRNQAARLEETQKATEDDVKQVYTQIGDLQEEVRALRAAAGASGRSSPDLSAATGRIEALEQRVAELQTALAAQKKEFDTALAAQSKRTEDRLAKLGKTVGKTTERPAATRAAPGPAQTRPTRDSSVAAPKPERAPGRAGANTEAGPKSRGFYYKVQRGDTLQTVAKRFSTSTQQICGDNHLPASAKLVPGQQLYIVRK